MSRNFGVFFSIGAVILLSPPCSAAPRGKARRVSASRPMGPSALAAARLKNNPPRNWIRHYLPADRYKIAGGIWKYVSTELDTYYHRPDSALMLQQPAGMVIGFASIADAEEAGYLPARGIPPFLRSQELSASPLFAGSSGRAEIGGSSNGTVVIREQDIPPAVFELIRTVDALSNEILLASSDAELSRVARKVSLLRGGSALGAASALMSGAQNGGVDLGSVQGIAQMLNRAIEAKRGGGNAAGIPVVEQLLNAAKSGARALIPAVQNQFSQQMRRNNQNMLNRNPN